MFRVRLQKKVQLSPWDKMGCIKTFFATLFLDFEISFFISNPRSNLLPGEGSILVHSQKKAKLSHQPGLSNRCEACAYIDFGRMLVNSRTLKVNPLPGGRSVRMRTFERPNLSAATGLMGSRFGALCNGSFGTLQHSQPNALLLCQVKASHAQSKGS